MERADIIAKKPSARSRKSQSLAQVVHDTTEASIFENVVAESRAAVLNNQIGMRMQEVSEKLPQKSASQASKATYTKNQQRQRKRVGRSSSVTKKPALKARKSQRTGRIVHETTEHSIYENIVSESQAAILNDNPATETDTAGEHSKSNGQEEVSDEEPWEGCGP